MVCVPPELRADSNWKRLERYIYEINSKIPVVYIDISKTLNKRGKETSNREIA